MSKMSTTVDSAATDLVYVLVSRVLPHIDIRH